MPGDRAETRAETTRVSIAVVIPLYNKGGALERTLDSIASQSRLPDEIVIVDDGSTDDSLAIANAYVARMTGTIRCVVLSQSNSGVSVARNRGADSSTARYIAFLDADDEWLPDYLAEVERLAMTCPSASFLTIRHGKRSGGSLVPEPCTLGSRHFGVVDDPLDHYRRGYGLIHTSAAVIRRDAWERSGGFPVGARKSQDIHLWLRLCLTETLAHSGRTLVVWHDDFSGVTRRRGVVPCHFSYFLGTHEGRRLAEDPALMAFLGTNMLAHIGGHRLANDEEVVRELLSLSKELPWRHRLLCEVAARAPRRAIRQAAAARRRLRA